MNNRTQILNDYLDYCQYKSLATNTVVSYQTTITSFLDFCNINDILDLQTVTPEQVCSFINYLSTSSKKQVMKESSLNLRRQHLIVFNRYLNHRKKITNVFVDKYSVPRKKEAITPIVSFTEEQVIQIINATKGTKNRLMAQMLFLAGMRREEVVDLTIYDINIDKGLISFIGKGQKPREVDVDKQILLNLVKLHKDTTTGKYPNIFIANSGNQKPYLPGEINRRFSIWLKDAGIDSRCGAGGKYTPHKVRATLCDYMQSQGCDMITIADTLGHASVQTVTNYFHRNEASKREALLGRAACMG